MNSYISVVLSTRGRILGTISFFTDTGRSLSADDAEMAEDLSRRAATAIDNARLYDQAQRAVRVRDDMLAIVTHDLRTPLSAIVAAAAMQKASASDDDRGRRVRLRAETIQRAADHMSRLIRDLADIGQMDAGRFAIERTRQDPSAIAREVVDTLQPTAGQRGCQLQANIVGTTVIEVTAPGLQCVQPVATRDSGASESSSSLTRPADVRPVSTRTRYRGEDLPRISTLWGPRGETRDGPRLPISKRSSTPTVVDLDRERAGMGLAFFFTLPR